MSKTSVTNFFNIHGDEIIKLRKSGMMVKDISAKYNNEIPIGTISNFLRKNNVLVRKPLTDDDKRIIVERYKNGESPKSICKDFHVTSSRIPKIVHEYGYPTRSISQARRTYNINENYFDNIDCQNKAYIIGLLIADGSRSSIGHAISISLVETDKSILEKINDELESNRPLKLVELSKKNPNYSNQYKLNFNSEHMCAELEKYGITPKKDFTTKFPDIIDESLYGHVIRGILDGDGFINTTEGRTGITGNEDLLLFIKEYVEEKLGVHCSITTPHKGKKTRDLRVSGRNQCKVFLDYIYNDAEMYIERKYMKYKSLYDSNILSCAS